MELHRGGLVARAECVPYPRYGESVDSVLESIASVETSIRGGLDRASLPNHLGPGAARNAIDCALWELEAAESGRSVADLAGLSPTAQVTTAFTIALDSAKATEAKARAEAARPLLKLKLGGSPLLDLERVEAARRGAPAATLIVDANESLDSESYAELSPRLAALGVALIEQPLTADHDEALLGLPRPVPLCADESFHVATDLSRIVGRYDAVNVKLDKAGGLSESLRCIEAARARGLGVMVGCMVSTSLGITPALLLAQGADWVDLDGPLLLERDRPGGLRYRGSVIDPPLAPWG